MSRTTYGVVSGTAGALKRGKLAAATASESGKWVLMQPHAPNDLGVVGHQEEREKPAHGRAHHRGVGRPRARAELPVDPWHQLLDQEPGIGGRMVPGRVLLAPRVGAPGADHDDRRDDPALDQPDHRLVHAPVHAGVRDAGVEEVLSVVHVQHGVADAECSSYPGGSHTSTCRAGSRNFDRTSVQ